VRLEGLGELKNQLTSSGIEPSILQLVAYLKVWKKLFWIELTMDLLLVMFMKLVPKKLSYACNRKWRPIGL
jgi:hypothetical protein